VLGDADSGREHRAQPAHELQPCLGGRQGVARAPGEQLNVGEVPECPGEIVGLPDLPSDLGGVVDEPQALLQPAGVSDQRSLGAQCVTLEAARSGAAREIERGLDRCQPLTDVLADHQERGVVGHHGGLGRRRRTVGEHAHRPLERLNAGHRLTRHPRVGPGLQVGQRNPLDVGRAGQLCDGRQGQGSRPQRLARGEPGCRGLFQQRRPVRSIWMALWRGFLPQRQGGFEMIGSLRRRPHEVRPPGCLYRRAQSPRPVAGRLPVQRQHTPPRAGRIDDRLVRLHPLRRAGATRWCALTRGQRPARIPA
jgi:hypothetical protein